ncbi:MerR family transcriptional regulator [Paenibacillus beijingensis]|uniref:MerR family transcriptional regulator n=1 Tax=Paenibacillus beijingensis TaxID=1126833 RepID=A0A0D5NJD7_9BACL|nr:MerR family transcriptional regulator [Paenibacillus beijingensis]AJY75489.1 MerR family transcriptional regulator [Paenibacillus beijingensis]
MYKVKQVAELAGISVRTLHHYDDIGLLKPAEVGENGYRLYKDEDLERLQQILFFRELDVPLQEIAAMLDRPDYDRKCTLLTHKTLLTEKKNRLERLIRSVDQTIRSIEGGEAMSKQEMFEPFDMKKIEEHQKKYEAETEQRWGHTDAYKESQRRTASYKEEDWKRIKESGDDIYRRLIAAMPKGAADEETQRIIAEHRQYISDNFYECSLEIYRGLGEMYVNDPRFTKNIDKYEPGLAAFFREAIHVYCDGMERK